MIFLKLNLLTHSFTHLLTHCLTTVAWLEAKQRIIRPMGCAFWGSDKCVPSVRHHLSLVLQILIKVLSTLSLHNIISQSYAVTCFSAFYHLYCMPQKCSYNNYDIRSVCTSDRVLCVLEWQFVDFNHGFQATYKRDSSYLTMAMSFQSLWSQTSPLKAYYQHVVCQCKFVFCQHWYLFDFTRGSWCGTRKWSCCSIHQLEWSMEWPWGGTCVCIRLFHLEICWLNMYKTLSRNQACYIAIQTSQPGSRSGHEKASHSSSCRCEAGDEFIYKRCKKCLR